MNEQQSKRTIEEVIDVETGAIIKSEDFFKNPESEIIAYRRRLQEAIAGFEPPKFRCAYCNQLLKLSGKTTRRGEVSFFAHLHDSDDCEIKTNGEYTKEEIESKKYSNIRESQRHIDLKNEISNALQGEASQLLQVKNVEIEKRITSNVPYLYWRQPDISAQIQDKNVVFELQLSTTFLSAIIDRDIFYRLHNIFIVWIFNFSDNQEYVNLNNLMCKDIYYANKRNAFVFDEKARNLSQEEKQLVLLCIWFEPYVENGIFNSEKSIRKEQYIRLSDLKFNYETYKPYYIDADAMFLEHEPELKNIYKKTEALVVERIERMEEQTRYKEKLLKNKESQIEEIKNKIKEGKAILQLFQKNKKWGFETEGIEVIEAKHSEATGFVNNSYAKLKYNKKYGFIDKFGTFIFQYNFTEAFEIFNNKCVVKYEKEWYIIDLENVTKSVIDCFEITSLPHSKKLLRIVQRDTKKIFSGVNRGGYNTYRSMHIDNSNIASMEGNNIDKCLCYIVYEVKSGNLVSQIDKFYVCMDTKGNEIKIEEQEATYVNKVYFGITDFLGNIIIPFEYDLIENFIEGKAKATKNGKFGYIDEANNIAVSFEYNSIENFIEGKAKATKEDYYSQKVGYINEQGDIIIPFEYESIENFIEGKAKAKKNGKFGYIDEANNIVVSFEYNSIENFIEGKAKATQVNYSQKFGYINEQGDIIVPFEYDLIENFIEGKAKATKNGKFGYIDELNNILVSFEYDSLENFVEGQAKATKNGKLGYIDEKGTTLIKNVEYITTNLLKGKKFEKWGVEDTNKNIIIPFEYDLIENFANGKAKAKKNGKFGYIDEQGNTLIPFEYQSIENFVGGKAKAEKVNYYSCKFGLIDEGGNIVIPFEYDLIENFIEGKAKARKNGKFGYIDNNGNATIPFEYDLMENFIEGKAKVIKNGCYGIIDKNGDGFFIFKEFKRFIGKYNETIEEPIYGIKDTQENIIIGASYDKIENFGDILSQIYTDKQYIGGGRFMPRFKYKVGCINEKGILVIPCVFDEIGKFVNGKAKAKKNDRYMIIDEQGHEVIRKKVDIDSVIINSIYDGKISNIVEFGVFVKLEDGLTALLHISELKKHKKSCEDYVIGEEITVKVLSIDKEKNRISLTLTS